VVGLKDIKMVHRIEVIFKVFDTKTAIRKKKLEAMGFAGKIKEVSLIDVYTIEKKLNSRQLQAIASSLSNPVSQITTIDKSRITAKFTCAIETGFLPGVTDNVGNTAKEIIKDLLKTEFSQNEGVYFSQLMLVNGNLSEKNAHQIADNLINPLIQRVQIKNFRKFKKDSGMDMVVPRVKLIKKPQVDIIDLNIGDEELIKLGKEGIINKDGTKRGPLALDLTYLKVIRAYFNKLNRNPTDIELESIAQTWSEHCKHTIFADPIDDIKKGLFKTYIQKSTQVIRKKKGKNDFCVSVFDDNSGGIVFDKEYLITHKVETHNSPSALDPFGGSITGIVGVNRDAIGFGMGAKPVVNVYGFCFADPATKTFLYKGPDLTQKMLSSRRIINGVIEGVNSGGNCSGIPTPQGFVYFDQRYQGKPLVFVGTLGLIPKKTANKPAYLKKARPGDLIVMIGGRVGLDGIHGATFSSEAMDTGSPATAVQIGDPITQKKFSDAIAKEARDLDLYNSITDNGAGGLSCSVAEMAKESGGCLVELEKVPLKYPGLAPWQTWISESQERMTLAVPKKKWARFSDLMKRRGVEATIIGRFTDSGKCIVKYNKKIVLDIDMDFLHDGLPERPMTTTYTISKNREPKINKANNLTKVLFSMLSRLNIASFEFISRQYDHEVQGTSVLKPLAGRGRINTETTVVKPILKSDKGIVISQSINPSYGDIDTYQMAACTIDTAIRNAVAAGADLNNLALLDNFCWCSSNEAERLGQLKRAVKACYDYTTAYQTPFISGKDSMFNDFKGYDEKNNPVKISIPPTLLISSIGVVDDITKTVSIDVKSPGDFIYILGKTNEEMGGSEYYALYKSIGNTVPQVDIQKNKKLYRDIHRCIEKGLVASAISVNRGGLAIALAKMAMAGMLGIDVSLQRLPGNVSRDNLALFSESQGRIIVTVRPENKNKFEKIIKGNPFLKTGKVADDNYITIKGKKGNNIIKMKVEEAQKAFKSAFKNF
jgi:phosphoribosylformylglycinamidine synthase II